MYANIDNIKGKLKEKLENDKDKAFLSRTLGTIDIDSPINKDLGELKVKEWDKEAVLEKFQTLKFNRFIDRFDLKNAKNSDENKLEIKIEYEKIDDCDIIKKIIENIYENQKIFYYLDTLKDENDSIIKEKITGITVYDEKSNKEYLISDIMKFKEVFEDSKILKIGYKQKKDYILLKQNGINAQNLMFDIEIAGYILNSNISKYSIEYLANEYLRI